MTVEQRAIPVLIPEGVAQVPVSIDDHDEPHFTNTTITIGRPLPATSETKEAIRAMREVYSAAICKTLEDIGVWGTNMDIQELTRGLVNLISYNSEMTFASYPTSDQEIAVKVSRQPDGNPQVKTQVAALIP